MRRLKRYTTCGRRGLTLIELLVVISLMTVLATLTVVYVVPAFRDNKNVQRGVDQVATALLIAKQRALRDQAPRGVRFLIENPGDPASAWRCSELQYIEVPADFRVPKSPANSLGQTVTFTFPPGTDLYGGAPQGSVSEYLVQPGDFLRSEVGTPINYLIYAVPTANSVQINPLRTVNPALLGSPNWRILRQPRPLAGEDTVKLPAQVVVDIGYIDANFANYQAARRQVPAAAPGTNYYEVLFEPGGSVMHRVGTPMVLWVRQADAAPANMDPTVNLLLAVYPRTGMISTHPIDPQGAAPGVGPLTFAVDGKSSGM